MTSLLRMLQLLLISFMFPATIQDITFISHKSLEALLRFIRPTSFIYATAWPTLGQSRKKASLEWHRWPHIAVLVKIRREESRTVTIRHTSRALPANVLYVILLAVIAIDIGIYRQSLRKLFVTTLLIHY